MAKTQWQKDPDHGFIWNCIDHLATWYDGREKHAVNRKTYLRLCILGILAHTSSTRSGPFWGCSIWRPAGAVFPSQ